jgi:hypothetical protein
MAKSGKNDATVYSHLVISKNRRYGLIFVCALLTLGFGCWIWLNLRFRTHVSWPVFAIPIVATGLACLRMRPTEEWSYRPWQKAPQRYERNIYD